MEERNIGGIATMELKELILVWTCGGVANFVDNRPIFNGGR
jgi:hypothetical protein